MDAPNTARVRRRDFEIVGIKNHAAVAPSAPRRVRNHSLHLPRFFPELKYSLYFFHDAAFCSFTLCILLKIFFPAEPLFYSLHVLCFLWFFKWGVKFRANTQFHEATTLTFCVGLQVIALTSQYHLENLIISHSRSCLPERTKS